MVLMPLANDKHLLGNEFLPVIQHKIHENAVFRQRIEVILRYVSISYHIRA